MPETTSVRAKNFHDLRQAAIKAGAPAIVDDMIRAASANFPHLDSAGDGKDDRELEASFYLVQHKAKNEGGDTVLNGEISDVGVTVSVVGPASSKKR